MSNIVERLRSPANVFYEYAADNGAFLREAADEITRLRAALAAVTAERDRMRALLVCLYDAAGPLDADKMPADDFAQIITIVLDARAALECVPETPR